MQVENDPIGVGVDIDRTTHCAGAYGVFVAVEPHQARLRRRGFVVYETRRSTAIGDKLGPYARVQAIGLTRWCEHMCRERRSYCRSLPTKTVSTASSWDVSQTIAMEAYATRTIGAGAFLVINPRFVKPFVKEFWR